MKHKLNNKSGFTLIEVIIVVIILGVLAGLALPRIVGQVARSRSVEAANEMGVIMRALDSCVNPSILPANSSGQNLTALQACDTFAEIGVTAPAAAAGGASFNYADPFTVTSIAAVPAAVFTAAGAVTSGNTIRVIATYAPGGVASAADTITFTYDASTGGAPVAGKVSAGIFGGIRWQ